MNETGESDEGRDTRSGDRPSDGDAVELAEGFANTEERLRILFERAPDAYYLNDLKGRFVDGNRAAEELCGFSKEELVGKSFLKLKLLAIADVPRAASHLARNALGLPGGPDELTIIRKDGTKIPVEVRTYPVTIDGQKLVLGIARDVSERRLAEDGLRRARDELARRVEERTAELSEALRSLEQEVAERKALEETLRAQGEALRQIADSSLKGISLATFCRLVLERLVVATRFDLGSIRLVDERAEELVLVATAGLSAKVMARVEGSVSLSAEDRTASIVARRRETVVAPNTTRSDVLAPAAPSLKRLGVGALLAGPLVGRDGSLLGVLQIAGHRKRSAIDPVHRSFFASIADVLATAVERDRVRAELAESLARHDAVISQADECIFLVDVETLRILEANPATQRFLGYSEEELVKMDLYDVVAHPPEDVNNRVLEILEGDGAFLGERLYRKKDGTEVPAEVGVRVIALAGRRVMTVVSRDVSERRALEAQLRHAQKMEAVGRLAGGVAHDFNNMLTAMSGFAELLIMRRDDPDAVTRGAEAIIRASDRAASFTRQLLAFSRRQVLDRRVTSLNDIVSGLEELLLRLLRSKVSLEIDLDPDARPVAVDAAQMDQVLMNLVLNAQDAMPDGGTVTIRTANVSPGEGGLEAVRLSVSDTGTGMDKGTLEKVFEPFFTTKPQGKGTGLGLSVVYGIVKQHGGRLHVESEPARGTTFVIELPLASGEEGETELSSPARRLAGEGELVLLVEGDERVRAFAAEALAESGYRVAEAGDADEALGLARAEKPDLVLSDIGLPGESGVALAAELQEIDPSVPVVFTSGLDGGGGSSEADRPRGVTFLQKPFKIETLLAAVKLGLDSRRGAS